MNGRCGGFLHRRILLEPVAAFFTSRGAQAIHEYPVPVHGLLGFVDLLIRFGLVCIVCEAELTTRRIPNDVAKALALKADLLLILVPTWAVARAGKVLLRRLPEGAGLEIWILPPGAARQRFAKKYPLMTGAFVPLSNNQMTHQPRERIP